MKQLKKEESAELPRNRQASITELGQVVISDKLTLGEIYRSTGKKLSPGLEGVTVSDMNSALKKAERDPVAGISHAPVKKDGKTGIGLHVAAVESGVNPHVHQKVDEDYVFLEGMGVMWLGKAEVENGRATVAKWEPHEVREGMVLTVPGGYAHRLENSNGPDKPIKIAFTCPDSHLGSDRFATEKPPGSKK